MIGPTPDGFEADGVEIALLAAAAAGDAFCLDTGIANLGKIGLRNSWIRRLLANEASQ